MLPGVVEVAGGFQVPSGLEVLGRLAVTVSCGLKTTPVISPLDLRRCKCRDCICSICSVSPLACLFCRGAALAAEKPPPGDLRLSYPPPLACRTPLGIPGARLPPGLDESPEKRLRCPPPISSEDSNSGVTVTLGGTPFIKSSILGLPTAPTPHCLGCKIRCCEMKPGLSGTELGDGIPALVLTAESGVDLDALELDTLVLHVVCIKETLCRAKLGELFDTASGVEMVGICCCWVAMDRSTILSCCSMALIWTWSSPRTVSSEDSSSLLFIKV